MNGSRFIKSDCFVKENKKKWFYFHKQPSAGCIPHSSAWEKKMILIIFRNSIIPVAFLIRTSRGRHDTATIQIWINGFLFRFEYIYLKIKSTLRRNNGKFFKSDAFDLQRVKQKNVCRRRLSLSRYFFFLSEITAVVCPFTDVPPSTIIRLINTS